MTEIAFDPTATGQQSAYDSTLLAYQPGHVTPEEWNNPIAYGQTKVDPSLDPIGFAKWKLERQANAEEAAKP